MNIDTNIPAFKWWNKQRLKYNIGLLVSGFLALLFYIIFFYWVIVPKDNSTEFTFRTLTFQGIIYLSLLIAANLIYFIGPILEILIHPADKYKFRKIAFGIGFWFSFCLPLLIPLLGLITNI
jgi:hypothetical protein